MQKAALRSTSWASRSGTVRVLQRFLFEKIDDSGVVVVDTRELCFKIVASMFVHHIGCDADLVELAVETTDERGKLLWCLFVTRSLS